MKLIGYWTPPKKKACDGPELRRPMIQHEQRNGMACSRLKDCGSDHKCNRKNVVMYLLLMLLGLLVCSAPAPDSFPTIQ